MPNECNQKAFTPSAVSEIAIKAKTDSAYLLPLWQDVKQFVYKMARAYIGNTTRLYDMDDLMQEGFIALFDAVRTYELKGMQFTSWLAFYLPRAFRLAAGDKNDAIRYTQSTTVEDKDGDEVDLLEQIPDESAERATINIVGNDAAAFLLRQIKALPEKGQRDCFIASAAGKPLLKIAEEMQTTRHSVSRNIANAARLLRKNPQIRATYPEYYQLPMYKSLTAFNTTWSSIVEDAVIKREQFKKGCI